MHSGSTNCPALDGDEQYLLYDANIVAHLEIKLSLTPFRDESTSLNTPLLKEINKNESIYLLKLSN
jgi:hypothetical protein